MLSNNDLKFMLVTHRQSRALGAYLTFIEQCVLGGVTSVQLREKGYSPCELRAFALALKALLDNYHIPLIINDNVELALDMDAAGVHLGQSDGCVMQARERLGSDKYIGVSLESLDDLANSHHQPIDYVAASAVFKTATKTNVRTHWGLDGVTRLKAQTSFPLIAIGGITLDNTAEVIAAGADGIAVIAALHEATEPQQVAQQLKRLISRNRHDTYQ